MSKQTPIVFKGDAGDYFGIWIVNVLLSMCTLGIYSAWAKVRRKKYFYNNTLIDGVGFDYHADPIAILKGRLIAFVFFAIYMVVSGMSPVFGAVLALILTACMPWIIVRGMVFNARNTSHRGLRFDFDAKTTEAALVFIVYPILIVLSLGFALPFFIQRTNQFFINHHKFGTSHFQMNALVKDFYMVYLKLFGALLILGIILSVSMGGVISQFKSDTPAPVSINQHRAKQTGFIKVAANSTEQNNVTEPEQNTDEIKLTPEDQAEVEKMLKEIEQGGGVDHHAEKAKDPVEQAIEKAYQLYGAIIFLAVFGILLLYALVLILIVAYTKSRITNLVLNNTSLDHIQFTSNQRMRDLLGLYLTNGLLLMFTGGLAMPWTQIRSARYYLEHLAIQGEADLDKFVGEKKESAKALGEELADMFDVDISFG